MSPKKGIEKRWNQLEKKSNFGKKILSEILDDSGGTWANKKDEKNEECFDISVYKKAVNGCKTLQ